MDRISQQTFSENLNTKFRLRRGDDDVVVLELIECKDLGSTPNQEQFSIVFRGPREPFLEQMTYELEHDTLGEVLIFLVPVKQEPESFYYEAVFNRFIDESE
jgi:hypothetical protein